VVLHQRPVGSGAAAAIGMAVAVASLFTFGAVFLAGRVVGESLGWHSADGPVSGADWAVSTLFFGVFGLIWTWWYALPFGALGGWLAWRAASRRTPRAVPSPVRVD
jgi:hypothetical protein